MSRNWSDPVTRDGGDPVDQLVSQYDWVMRLIDPLKHDALALLAWEQICERLNEHPLPETPEAWNARWCVFVAEAWGIWERYWQRRTAERAVQAKRAAAAVAA